MRHVALLEEARGALAAARGRGVGDGAGGVRRWPICRRRATRFDEIVGTRTSEDVLQHIFERFCIGK